MPTNELRQAYFIKNKPTDQFEDVAQKFNGVRILAVEGVAAKGEAVNVYTAQWVDSETEDFMITTLNEQGNPQIIRKNVDIKVTFMVHQKFANELTGIDVKIQHDNFVHFMTSTDVWIKTSYQNNVIAHCVCLDKYEPTTMKLKRDQEANYALGTITLHCLETVYVE